MHYKTAIVMGAFSITVSGWWAWQALLSGVYTPQPSPYAGRGAFVNTFGKDTLWWSLLFGVLLILIGLDIAFKLVKRHLILHNMWSWPPWRSRDADDSPENCENWDRQLWQELEQEPTVREHLRQALLDETEGHPDTAKDRSDEAGVDLETRISTT
jgi:phospholipid-translocating ATPase